MASPSAQLRVWTPQGAEVLFVRQVAPTDRGPRGPAHAGQRAHRRVPTRVRGATRAATTTWRCGVPAKAVGNEQLAARVQLVVRRRDRRARAWCRRCGPTTRASRRGSTRRSPTTPARPSSATAIQEGLAAKASGDDDTATAKLGRAVQLAKETGNDEATSRLKKVVDVEDPETGTVRLKRDVSKHRRDGARHALDQDDEGEVAMTTVRCPEGHESTSVDYCDVCGVPIDASAAPSAPHPPRPRHRPRRPLPIRHRRPLRHPRPLPRRYPAPPRTASTAERRTRPTRCSARTAATTSPPVSSRRPRRSPAATASPPGAAVSGTPTIEWVAEIWVDPDWYARNRDEATDPCPPAGTPKVAPLSGASRAGRPAVHQPADPPAGRLQPRHGRVRGATRSCCSTAIVGSSRTSARPTARSSPVPGVLPSDPIPSGQRRELGDNDRIYVGTWTRIVVRRAMAHEALDQKVSP